MSCGVQALIQNMDGVANHNAIDHRPADNLNAGYGERENNAIANAIVRGQSAC